MNKSRLTRIPRTTQLLLISTLITMGLTWVLLVGLIRYLAAFSLLWLLPGIAWAGCYAEGNRPTRVVMGMGTAFVSTGLATLLLHFIPGPFPKGVARLVYSVLAIFPTFLQTRNTTPSNTSLATNRTPSPVMFIVLLVVTLLMRLPNLNYSEFQGDEAVIMQRAAQALAGDDEELFLHQKGPVEILTPLALWALTDTVNEWQVRLPFTMMGLLAVVTLALLASHWFDARVGFITGLLLAVNGLLVAFSRIVQYQNIVVTMGALGLLSLTLYKQYGKRHLLLSSAAFIAYGLLAHYDAVLIGPVALWLLVISSITRRDNWQKTARHIGLAILVGIIVLSMFYIPFMLNPMFSRTFAYLSAGRLGGDSFFHNSTKSVWTMSVFYTSLYYILGLGLSVIGAIFTLLKCKTRREKRYRAWLYFLIPFAFYTFIVIDPRTHIYTLFPGVAIVVGDTLVTLWDWLRQKQRKLAYLGGLLVGGWYVLCAGYIVLAFISHQPEFKRELPESQHPLYPVPQDLPLYGYFGFPYRAGWKAMDGLYEQGLLHGTYNSNEEPEITTWYVHQGQRTLCGQPDNYIIASNVQDEIAIDWGELERDYTLTTEVQVSGQSKLAIYQRLPEGDNARHTVNVADFVQDFDAQATVATQLLTANSGTHPVNANFGEIGRLLGYDISATVAHPGETVRLTLYWEALSSPAFNYQVFAHVVVEGALVAQHDGAPACAAAPTSLWEQGEFIRDEHDIVIPPDATPGEAHIFVGMYDLLTLTRVDIAENAPENVVALTSIQITQP